VKLERLETRFSCNQTYFQIVYDIYFGPLHHENSVPRMHRGRSRKCLRCTDFGVRIA